MTRTMQREESPRAVNYEGSDWATFFAASVAVMLVSLDSTMLFSIFEEILHSFKGSSLSSVSWVMNAYTITYAAILVPAGGIADRFGAKKTFLVGVFLFTLASALCGAALTISLLILARVIQAIGAALLTPASLSIVLQRFLGDKRPLAISLWGAIGGFSAAIGPTMGAYLAHSINWKWAFLINVPVGLTAIIFGIKYIETSEGKSEKRPLDMIGILFMIIAVASLTGALVEPGSPHYDRVIFTCLVCAVVISAGGFILWSQHTSSPLIDLSLFDIPAFTIANVATLAFGATFSIMFFAFFFFLKHIWQYDQLAAGLAVAPGPLTVIPIAIGMGKWIKRHGIRPPLVVGSIIYAASGVWFLMLPETAGSYLTQWLPGLILSGAGVGLIMPSLSTAAVQELPLHSYATGSAINQAIRQLGGVLGVALTMLILGQGKIGISQLHGLYWAYIALALFTAALGARIPSSHSR